MTLDRIHHDTVGSTNDLAKSLARGGVARPLLVSAGRQTDGRGRQGRRWVSPIGGAWMSLVWPAPVAPPGGADPLHAAPLVAGLAVAEAIDSILRRILEGHRADAVRIKWPNDVFLGGRKVAGVLCEREITPGRPGSPLIIGVGINVANDPGEVGRALALESGEPVRTTATSLSAYAFAPIAPAAVVDAFAEVAPALLARLATEGFDGAGGTDGGLRAAVVSRLAHPPGTPVGTPDGGRGTVVGVDAAGRLEVRDASGVVRAFVSGEVRLGAPDGTDPER